MFSKRSERPGCAESQFVSYIATVGLRRVLAKITVALLLAFSSQVTNGANPVPESWIARRPRSVEKRIIEPRIHSRLPAYSSRAP